MPPTAEDLPCLSKMLRFEIEYFHVKPVKQPYRKFVKLYNEYY